ncbi:EAL domain-containing protein [Noviherbaspirillum sp. DKR-6]|uniref:EAL domain-containing protein n=2 Tax=Noviherbaspirillum pedocola TaxID=2801341 RepID=A0A934SX56_9BURK|nr:EAL domain-containing protein [Noviherbaspirillum pedocola]
MMASYTALNLAARVSATEGKVSTFWLAGGAIAMGVGIWSMHFIGMLAFSLPIRMSYDLGLTFLSLLFAVMVSAFALFIVSRKTVGIARLVLAGTLMGFGICGMHYTGMAAMRMSPAIQYDPLLFLASVAIAISASIVALWIAFTLRADDSMLANLKKGGSAVVMGLAITAMHYTGMAAASFPTGSFCMAAGGVESGWLALSVGVGSLSVLSIALMLAVLDSRIAQRTAGLVKSLSDANQQLHHQALHDALTQLPNRSLLEDRICQAIAASSRSGRGFALMFLDLDRFKTINDSLGHHYGDKLLQAVAARLSASLRNTDTVARIGGDEFVVLAGDILNPQAAAQIAQNILSALTLPVEVDGQEQNVLASLGISLYPEDGGTLRELMSNADSAMYHAKRMGRGNYQFFTPEMNAAASARLALEKALRRALDQREFELHYQPKVDVKSGQVLGMEALLRWRHPERGLVPPAEFIPLAEEIGLIGPIGAWVLETACRQNRDWQQQGLPKLRVAVNLSAVQFRQQNLPEFVAGVLKDVGLDASCLELEVTESVVMHNAKEAAQILEKLHAQGIHISIDDFGTGYSSLSYLKQFRLDTLKIDRSFVRDISSDADDAAIVRSVIALAHSLRLGVIAEGVETSEQLAFLESLDCDEYQGYLRSKPLSVPDFEAFLRDAIGAEAAV